MVRSFYTNPNKVADFFLKMSIDALASSFGTVHGAFKGCLALLRYQIVVAVAEIEASCRDTGGPGVVVGRTSNRSTLRELLERSSGRSSKLAPSPIREASTSMMTPHRSLPSCSRLPAAPLLS